MVRLIVLVLCFVVCSSNVTSCTAAQKYFDGNSQAGLQGFSLNLPAKWVPYNKLLMKGLGTEHAFKVPGGGNIVIMCFRTTHSLKRYTLLEFDHEISRRPDTCKLISFSGWHGGLSAIITKYDPASTSCQTSVYAFVFKGSRELLLTADFPNVISVATLQSIERTFRSIEIDKAYGGSV